MKRVQIICISLAMMFSIIGCFNDSALNFIATTSNMDENSCLLNLTYALQANQVIFSVDQYIPDPINRSCTYQDIVTAPIFYNVPFTPLNLNLTASASNPNHLTTEWTFDDMKTAYGSSCMNVGVYFGQISYVCRFKFSSIYFYLDLWAALPDNTTFDATSTGILFPEHSAMRSTKYGFDIWVPNPSFPHIVGRLQDGCGADNWDNVVNSLSTKFTVTGTEYLSNTFDLHNYLNGSTFFAVLVLQNGAAAQNYLWYQAASDFNQSLPFNNAAADNCTDLGITYGSFLPNLNYCAAGCALSLVVYTSTQTLALVTNGIQTAPSLLRA